MPSQAVLFRGVVTWADQQCTCAEPKGRRPPRGPRAAYPEPMPQSMIAAELDAVDGLRRAYEQREAMTTTAFDPLIVSLQQQIR